MKTEFEGSRSEPPLHPEEPQYGGAALWVRGLFLSIEREHELLEAAQKSYLSFLPIVDEAEATYTTLRGVLNEYITKKYTDWMAQLQGWDQAAIQKKLECPLMRRIPPERVPGGRPPAKDEGRLECNFDKELLSLFGEVYHWEKFHGEHPIPYVHLTIFI